VNWTNDPQIIAKKPYFASINATTEVDLMGLAVSETMGGHYWLSSGAQADFARGAMHSPGGKAFLVLHSTASNRSTRTFACARLCRGDAPSHRCRDAAISRSTYSGGCSATK
jgi:Acetyl-CoA hydrolase/transferase C-terminal domain